MRPMTNRGGATLPLIAAAVAILAAPGCAASHYRQVACEGVHRQSIFILEAQAVPSATFIPCVEPLPAGWGYGGSDVRSGIARFWLNSELSGAHAVEYTLTRACDVSRAREVPLAFESIGLRKYEEPADRVADITVQHYVFTGGCVTSRFAFTRHGAPSIFDQVDGLIGFTPRSVYVNGLRQDEGLTLCGAGAPPCPG
jgi:hypothetical protein